MRDGLSSAGFVFSMIILGILDSSTIALCQIAPSLYPFPESFLHLAPSSCRVAQNWWKGGTSCAWLVLHREAAKMKGMAAPLPWNPNELAALCHLWFCPSINIIPFTPLGCSQLCIMLGSFWPL